MRRVRKPAGIENAAPTKANPGGLELDLVTVLDALFEERSVTKVAHRLGVSQPTISFALAKLRRFFDDSLFVRHAGEMHPTQFALTLRQPVREVLTIIDREIIRKTIFEPEATEREFTLCTSDIGELCFVPSLMEAFRERAPNATLKSVSLPGDEVKMALLAGKVDVALGYFPDLASKQIGSRLLFNHPFVCVARLGHPLFSNSLDRETFERCHHAVVHHEGRSQEIAEQIFERIEVKRRVFLHSAHFVSLPFHIVNSDLISIVPRSLVKTFEKLLPLQSAKPPIHIPDIPLCQHWVRRSSSDPAIAWFLALIQELFLGRDPTMTDSCSAEIHPMADCGATSPVA